MRVLHVLSGLMGGGAELAMARLAGRLQREGVHNTVLCLGPGGPAEAALRESGVEIRFLGAKSLGGAVRRLPRLRSILASARPDVIQGWMYQGALAATTAAALRGGGVPVVWSIRQTLPPRPAWKERLVVGACRLLSATPAAIVYNARAAAAQAALRGFATTRAAVIPNGVDTENFRPLSAGEKAAAREEFFDEDGGRLLACAAGRSHPMKDHETFVRAAALVARRFPEASFLLAGRGLGSPFHPLHARARELGVASHFVFADEQYGMERFLGMVDVMVSSSAHSEAFPNVIAEAMACGVPCVGTDVGDTAALIGDSGITVAPRDAEALAGAIASLFSLSSSARALLGARARARILERFPLEENVRAHLELYRALARAKPA